MEVDHIVYIHVYVSASTSASVPQDLWPLTSRLTTVGDGIWCADSGWTCHIPQPSFAPSTGSRSPFRPPASLLIRERGNVWCFVFAGGGWVGRGGHMRSSTPSLLRRAASWETCALCDGSRSGKCATGSWPSNAKGGVRVQHLRGGFARYCFS